MFSEVSGMVVENICFQAGERLIIGSVYELCKRAQSKDKKEQVQLGSLRVGKADSCEVSRI